MTPSTFQDHLAGYGGLSRRNPELQRLALESGFSVEHLFKVATGRRVGSERLVRSVVAMARAETLTVESFSGGGDHGALAADDRKSGNGAG